MAKLKNGMTDEEKVEYATAVLEQLHDGIFAYNGSIGQVAFYEAIKTVGNITTTLSNNKVF